MRAMVLGEQPGRLEASEVPDPDPARGEVLIGVQACGVCRTDLHIVDGELTEPKLPLIPGHQVVGEVVAAGTGAERFRPGERVGVPWLGWACGECRYCLSGRENLCKRAVFTGYQRDGGFAELTAAHEAFAIPLPSEPDAVRAAPLLCAGLIGHRALRACGDPATIGLYGFGAAAHIVCQVAKHEGRQVFAFTRPGDVDGQAFALELGATWAGDSETTPPEPLDAAIIFAPAGELVPLALRVLAPGGTVVCAGIHMSEIPAFPYELLWGERSVQSVANLTRRDGADLMRIAPLVPIHTEVTSYPLEGANDALTDIRTGRLRGAAVLTIQGGSGG